MPKEIERKFLVNNTIPFDTMDACYMMQGYISDSPKGVVRIRICDSKAWLTIKGRSVGMTRDEFEYEVPLDDAKEMLTIMAQDGLIEKSRYLFVHEGYRWEIDRFHGTNEGLVVAEIELKDEHEQFPLPSFIEKEVTGDARYYNSALSKHPYLLWSDK